MKFYNHKIILKSIVVISFYICNITLHAQQIKGLVLDENGNNIIGAQLSIFDLNNESVLWEGTTDSLGVFTSPSIEIIDSLKLSAWHYDYLPHSRLLKSTDNNTEIKIILELNKYDVGEVVVTGNRSPMSFQKGDIIVDVAKMKNFERLTTTQLMNRIPGLSVENGQVTLYGKPAVIYINNTKQVISADAIIKYIESLPAKALSDIKLIPMPSSKYGKAEAVVEINMDSKMADGIFSNTSVYGDMMDKQFGSAGISEFFMYKKGNTTFNTMLNYDNVGGMSRFSDSLYLSVPNISTSSPTISKSRTNVIRSSSNLTIDLKNSSTLDFNLFVYYDQSKTKKDWSYTETQKTALQYLGNQTGSDDLYSITAKYATNKDKTNSLSIYYSGMYGSMKENGDYYTQDDASVYNGYLTNNNYMNGQQHSLTFDGLSNLLKNKLQLKYGIYLGTNILSDNTRNYNFDDASIQNSNRYKSTEFELRAYSSAEYNFTDNTGLSLDLSFDYSGSKYKNSNSVSGDNHTTLTYSNFVPRIMYWYRADNYRINLRFMTLNDKPNFNYLLAGQRYVNNYLYTVGNPNLKNKITYSLQAGQTFWDVLTINLYAGVVKNNISPYYATDANEQLYQSYANVCDKFYATAIVTLPFEFLNKKLYGSIKAHFQKGIYYNIDPILEIDSPNIHQFIIVYSGNMYYDITKRLTVQASISGSNKRQSTLQSEISAVFNFSPAISYTFLKDKSLTVEIQANSFLGKISEQQTSWNFAGNSYTTYNYAIPRYELKLSYRFNKGKEINRRDNMGNFSRILKN